MSAPLRSRRLSHLVAVALWVSVWVGCGPGQGEGEVKSEHLFAEGCVDGPFDLQPDFFASSPEQDTQIITIRRGDRMNDLSDGLNIVVYRVEEVIEDHLGEALPVRLPAGVQPPGHPPSGREQGPVALSLFLNDSCHEQDVSLHAVSGTITFSALFSGDLSERKRSERLIDGQFDVMVVDPRLVPADGSEPNETLLSHLVGDFRFYFKQGTSAQAFPGIE